MSDGYAPSTIIQIKGLTDQSGCVVKHYKDGGVMLLQNDDSRIYIHPEQIPALIKALKFELGEVA